MNIYANRRVRFKRLTPVVITLVIVSSFVAVLIPKVGYEYGE